MSYTSLKEFRDLPFKIPKNLLSHPYQPARWGSEAGVISTNFRVQFCLIDYVWIYWTPVVI